MSHLISSLVRTKQVLIGKKRWIGLLILLQLITLVLLGLILINYQLLLFEDLQKTVQPLVGANINQADLEKGQPLLDDVVPLFQGYHDLKKHAQQLAGELILVFLILNGWLWILSLKIVNDFSLKELFLAWLKYLALGVFFILLLAVIYSAILKQLSEQLIVGSLNSSFKTILIVTLVLYYIMLLMLPNIKINSWLTFIKKSASSITQFYILIPYFILVVFTLVGGMYLLIIMAESSPVLAAGLGLLTVIFLTFSRIFWIITHQESLKEES